MPIQLTKTQTKKSLGKTLTPQALKQTMKTRFTVRFKCVRTFEGEVTVDADSYNAAEDIADVMDIPSDVWQQIGKDEVEVESIQPIS